MQVALKKKKQDRQDRQDGFASTLLPTQSVQARPFRNLAWTPGFAKDHPVHPAHPVKDFFDLSAMAFGNSHLVKRKNRINRLLCALRGSVVPFFKSDIQHNPG